MVELHGVEAPALVRIQSGHVPEHLGKRDLPDDRLDPA